MTLATAEFIRRFLMHVLPKGLRRIRRYGLFANGNRAAHIAKARELLVPVPVTEPETAAVPEPDQPCVLPRPCPRFGGRMLVIEIFARGCEPKHRPTHRPPSIRIDSPGLAVSMPSNLPIRALRRDNVPEPLREAAQGAPRSRCRNSSRHCSTPWHKEPRLALDRDAARPHQAARA